MPAARATATSVLLSIVNVVSPSTSAGLRPASSSASSTASAANRSSLRPESFEKSVAPMPTMAALPDNTRHPHRQRRRRDDMVAKAIAAHHLYGDQTVLHGGHLAGERHRVVGVPRHPETQPNGLDQRRRAGPVGDVALHQPGVGQNVDEDVLGPLGPREVTDIFVN